jgi:molybdenum cofactor synthesis domain-containing protein
VSAIRVAIVTVSDKSSSGEREDSSGPAIRETLLAAGVPFSEVDYRVVPDERHDIAEALFHLSERADVDLVLTTGGTGLAPRDVTPQATLGAIEYEVPGIAEAMRAESLKVTPAGMLSRGVAGVRRRTLIVNLPGSPKAVRETLGAIAPALPHAISTLLGEVGEHSRPTD